MIEPDLFRTMFACAPTGALLLDDRGRVAAANPAFCALAGRPEAELLGERAVSAGEHELSRPDGTTRRTRWTVADQIAHVEDITPDVSAGELAAARAELEQFAYIASHDLSEPLRTVTGFVRLLARRYGDQLGAEAEEFMDYAVAGTERMRGLLDDLLAYSRAGRTMKELETVELDGVAAAVAHDLGPRVTETGAALSITPLPRVLGDAGQLAQVLRHLVDNALKFSPPGKPARVTITAERDGAAWLVTVADRGIGIAPEHVDRAFAVFQRLHARDEHGGGSGIGLPIARKIVLRHGGRLWHEPAPEGGSRFCFTLPVAPDETTGALRVAA